jgi:C1A family cysteine protease
VGQAVAQALRLSYLARNVACPELSARSVYRLARNIDGTETDGGTYLRSGCYAVQRLGCATEEACPFSEAGISDQLPFRALHSSFDRGGTRRYYRIAAGNTDAVRRAIAAGFPVVGGWSVDAAFVQSDGIALTDAIRGAIVGGHAMTIVGYDSKAFTVLGSWGDDYGVRGRIRATDGFVAQGTDLWAIDTDGDAP